MDPNDHQIVTPDLPWRDIDELRESDDLFWFLRWDSVGGYTEDGPREPQHGGYDADEWQWFAPCESPPIHQGANDKVSGGGTPSA